MFLSASRMRMRATKKRSPSDWMVYTVVETGVVARQAGAHLACDPVNEWLLVGGSYGLAAFDIRDPLDPRKIASCKTKVTCSAAACYVLVRGDLAYVVGGYGLAVISLNGLHSDPPTMKKIGGCVTGVCTVAGDEACVLQGDLLFVAGGHGLAVINVSQPREPTKITQIKTGVGTNQGGAHCIAHGELPIIYYSGGRGMAVIDVSNPTAPVKVGASIPTGVCTVAGNEGMEISADRRLLFMAGGGGLAIFDIASDPRTPKRLSHTQTGVATKEGGADLAVVSPHVIFVAGGTGIAAIDVSNPQHPKKLATTSSGTATRESGSHVSLYGERGERAFVVGGKGLAVLPTNHDKWVPPQQCCCQIM